MASITSHTLDTTISTIQTVKDPKRCGSCSKRLGLVQFACKCGGIYCSTHRGDTLHNCSYDYKSENTKVLSTTMVKLTSKKIEVV